MEIGNSIVSQISFFKSLREGISSISKNVSDIEKEMQSPSKHSEDEALTKLVNMSAEVKEMKDSAVQMRKDLEECNECNYQYYTHMVSLIEGMEKRFENLTMHLKDFGYVPPLDGTEVKSSVEPDLIQTESCKSSNNDLNTAKNGKEINNINTENVGKADLLAKTPICLSTNIYSTFNKAAIKGECLFPPTVKSCDNTTNSSAVENSSRIEDFSTSSGDNVSTHEENLYFALKHNNTPKNDTASPELPRLMSLLETRKHGTGRIITPENPTPSHKKVKATTPNDLLPSINVGKVNTPEDPPSYVYANNKVESPQTPKSPELTSNFQYHRC